jgi:hypothetical protein
MDILSQMIRLPFTLVAMSVEPFLQMARDADSYTYERRPSAALMSRPAGLPAPAMQSLQPSYSNPGPYSAPQGPMQASTSLASVLGNGGASSRREDLGDNMVKVLRWWIVWTKADEEEVFRQGDKVINYPTNPGSLASQILLGWAQDQERRFHNVNRESLQDPTDRKIYDALQNRDDWRYLQVKTELVERYALEDKHYDKRQTKAQERIAEELGGRIANEIGNRIATELGGREVLDRIARVLGS